MPSPNPRPGTLILTRERVPVFCVPQERWSVVGFTGLTLGVGVTYGDDCSLFVS
ncbi:hypothetical protein [Haloquadratum walsbyi]|uniref:hypothetical protein n=1 Tax=Haloquadratum walsbyi TaxID=293091 RepID=UPI000A80C7DB|nr:hypothetical protein [Haloquadratum walsbyi]